MLLAVLEKRGGLRFGSADVYLNVIGGLRLDEPAADLAIAIAVASAALDKPAPDTLAAIGEVGLTGEIRAVNQLNQRLSELHRLGFTRCLIPRSGTQSLHALSRVEYACIRSGGSVLPERYFWAKTPGYAPGRPGNRQNNSRFFLRIIV